MANVKKSAEKATIDCTMIVLRPQDTQTYETVGTDSDTQIQVEANVETSEAVRLVIKDVLKAQKKARTTLTGHTITITEGMTVLDFLPLLTGATLIKDQTTGEITGYNPPASGERVELPVFDMDVYSAVYSGAELVGYEKITYPNCTGDQIAPPGSQDGTFRSNDITIVSAPGNGVPPYSVAYIEPEDLPTLVAAVSAGNNG